MSLPRVLRPHLQTTVWSSPSSQPNLLRHFLRPRTRRFQSTKPPSPEPTPNTSSIPGPDSPTISRLKRLLPKRLHSHLAGFRAAPLSHVTAFLVLHEITAIVPVIGLAGAFYWLDVVPTEFVLGPWAGYASGAVNTWLKSMKRKGWFGMGEEAGGEERLEREIAADAEAQRLAEEKKGGSGNIFAFWRKKQDDTVTEDGDSGDVKTKSKTKKAISAVKEKVTWGNTEKSYKIGVQVVAAYAITKMLLYPRLMLSLWLTPSFARVMVRTRQAVWSRFRRSR